VPDRSRQGSPDVLDVLIVGAGPTGLTLAGRLASMASKVRIVDRAADRVHESRALAIQPRTLEVLRGVGVAQSLVDIGNSAVQLELRADGRRSRLMLFDIGIEDTAFPFLLFLSQAETERVLVERLRDLGTTVERELELVSLEQDERVTTCALRRDDGSTETVLAHHVVGCDGAHSTVRRLAGIRFAGASYAPTFGLGDVEADGDLDPEVAYAYLGRQGILFFFPIRKPTAWRVIGMLPSEGGGGAGEGSGALTLAELQGLVDDFAQPRIRLRDPAWLTRFGLAHRQAARYRSGRVFLAGDAAHVHSPAGAQGMNTGIQDAWNLGWKLALVSRRIARPELLDSYHAERWPIGRSVLRLSDRAFTAGTSTGAITAAVRTQLAPRLLPLIARLPRVRALAFRTISELAVNYRRSPAVAEGDSSPRRGPRAGDRLPDARVTKNDRGSWLHEALAAPTHHLLLCGPTASWDDDEIERFADRWSKVVTVHRLTREPGADVLHDERGDALRRLDAEEGAQYLVRPDGHVAFRSGRSHLAQASGYLQRWMVE
jgi:2-polyprenyl-6-methoxyphenol hydroxylase-like FAD-dependent oxidoreductase